MLSGNGRHRRPRQAPAIVVAAGVTGSAIAIPLLGAGSASAVDGAVWDRVAECESAGLWSANTGNGYYGGLQFSQQVWEDFGGTEYAARPDLASRSQQIAVAEKVLAAQGPQAWPSCGTLAGLAPGGTDTGAAVDPGPAPAPSGTPSGAPSGTPAPGQKAPGEQKAPGAKAPGKKTPAPGATAPAAPGGGSAGSGTPGAEPAPEATGSSSADPADPTAPTGPGGADKSRGTDGDRASRSDSAARPGANDQKQTGGTGAAEVPPLTYTVKPGDNLWAIAEEKKLEGGWPALYETNRETVGADPDLILPGQSLELGSE
ncbi:transglycosylase family protein [Streptomyces sp. NPDC051018]|uniref:transglycosylase family protein n=1 Tax=Streptomyces sp. NPDC051018 TaxID=3365639 RepID=UPI0037B929B6